MLPFFCGKKRSRTRRAWRSAKEGKALEKILPFVSGMRSAGIVKESNGEENDAYQDQKKRTV